MASGVRVGLSWAYVGFLVALPSANLVYRALKTGITPMARELLQPEALYALFLTLVVAGFTVLLNTVFGVLLAMTLARQRFRGRVAASVLVDLPLTISPVVAGFLFLSLYRPEGWLGRPLAAIGLQVLNTPVAVALASLFVTLPFVVRELTPLLAEIGPEQEDAAATLGSSRWYTFWRVILPSIRHGLTRGMSLTFARSVGEFGAAVVVSGNIIGQTQTLTLWVYQEAGDFNYAGAYAGALLLGLMSIGAFALAERARLRGHVAA